MDSAADTRCRVGCPIRRFRDQRVLAPPPDFSQRATSFIASRRQGIHQMPFIHSPRSSSEPPLAKKAHAFRPERPLAKRSRPFLADAEHPLRSLNRNGQKQAYHAWRSSNPGFGNDGEPPLRRSGMDELVRPTLPNAAADKGLAPTCFDDRSRCPRSTRLASSRYQRTPTRTTERHRKSGNRPTLSRESRHEPVTLRQYQHAERRPSARDRSGGPGLT